MGKRNDTKGNNTNGVNALSNFFLRLKNELEIVTRGKNIHVFVTSCAYCFRSVIVSRTSEVRAGYP